MLQSFDLQIDENAIEEGALKLLKSLRPKWIPENIKFMIFTEGISNKLIGCYEKADRGKHDAICIRVYGQKSDFLIDRSAENRNIAMLHTVGCAEPLYCKFANGIAYKFVPGVCLDASTVQDPLIRRLIAKEMVKLHSVDPSRILGEDNSIDAEPMLFKKTRHFLNLVPDQFTDPKKDEFFKKNFKSKKELLAEVDLLQEKLEALGSPVVFCHNDLLLQNIVYNKEEEKVSFIDHEYGAFNYMAFDIGDHFCEYAGVDSVDMDFTLYPDRKYQLEWFQVYLEYKAEAEGRDASEVTPRDIETLYVQVNQFALAAHFFWGCWGLVQDSISALEFDYIGYAKLKLDEYFNRKDEFLALTLPS